MRGAWIAAALCVAAAASAEARAAVPADERQVVPPSVDVTLLLGMAIFSDDTAGFEKALVIARQIRERAGLRGFIPGVEGPLSAELKVASVSVGTAGAFAFSAHLRWDFHSSHGEARTPANGRWRAYALGGLAGNALGVPGGTRWGFFPRFALGAMRDIGNDGFFLRGEASHELLAVGIGCGF